MKTVEEKARRYDEAIKRVENIKTGKCKTPFMFTEGLFEHIFPELKGSEDERIRKDIISYLALYKDAIGEEYESWLAWLEKQGEHANFRNKIQIGDKVTCNEDGVLVNLSQLKRIAKPAEEYNITGIGSKHAKGKLGEMIKNQNPVNEVLEQKPAWSEEDKRIIDNLVSQLCNLYARKLIKEETKDKYVNWLKSLKDRVHPQPKQAWSGGDEAHLHSLITHLEQWIERHPNTTGADIQGENIAWLKSLRPQNTWKPSEEQMSALKEQCVCKKSTVAGAVLCELFHDLEKLRGE